MRPVRDNDEKLLAAYERFFDTDRLEIVEISSEVIVAATALRARYGFKTPDAIHLASAIEEKVDLFLTGDASLARCSDVPVEILGAD